jgi:hypothetical protein
MPILQSTSDENSSSSFGSPGTGNGTDVPAELERLRSNLAALAQVLEDLRTKHNTHTHSAAVPAPPAAEQTTIPYTLH